MAGYERASRQVVEARYVGDYHVWLRFNNGRKGLIDLADDLHGDILEPLRDPQRFAQLYLDRDLATIAWEHGAAFTPEYLYEKLVTVH
jgi:hypothetical protein